MTTTDLGVPERALAIAAHPDDIEINCGGTLAKWARAGCQIFHLICTDGSKGSWDPTVEQAELVALRRDEQRRAAAILGGSADVVFLGWPDGELEAGVRQRVQVAAWIRRLRPDVVLGHDPWRRYRLHPDHRAAGFLTTDGVVAARDPLYLTELALAHHRPTTLLLFDTDNADHFEEVSTTFDIRVEAILAHRSQLETTLDVVENDPARSAARFTALERDRARARGSAAGLDLAEEFKRIDDL